MALSAMIAFAAAAAMFTHGCASPAPVVVLQPVAGQPRPAPMDYGITDDPLLVRTSLTAAPGSQPAGTVDDFIACRLRQAADAQAQAQASALLIAAPQSQPAAAKGTTATGGPAPVAASQIEPASPVTARPAVVAEPPPMESGQPGLAKLVMPRSTGQRPTADVAPAVAFSAPPARAASGPDGSSVKPIPPANRLENAPLGKAAMSIAGHVFTGDEILRPIWPELDRLAARSTPERHAREAMELIYNQIRNQITEHLVSQEAEKGLTDSAREGIDQTLNKVLRDNATAAGYSSIREMKQAWAHQGLDPDKEADRIRRHILVQAYLREKFLPQIHVVRPEAFAYYEKHLDEFTEEPRVHLKMIQINPVYPAAGTLTEEARIKAIDAARRRAGDVLAQIRSRAMDFNAAADKFSDAAGGADMKWIRRGGLLAHKVEDAAFALPVGKVSDVVEDTVNRNVAFYIVTAVESAALKVTPFSEAVNTIVPKLEEQKSSEQSQSYMTKLYKDSNVDERQVLKFVEDAYNVVPKPAATPR
jgi:hypothetical protein